MKQTIAMLLTAALLCCSCAGPQAASEAASQPSDDASHREERFGAKGNPDRPEDKGRRVIGRVTAINGNELELELVEAQQGEIPPLDSESASSAPQAQSGGQGQRPGNGASRTTPPNGQSRPQGGNGGNRPQGEAPGGTDNRFVGGGQSTAYKSTGETLTVTVPVGTPVSAIGRESNGSLSFNSIAKDNIIMVSYAQNQAGEEYIESIRVMQTAS